MPLSDNTMSGGYPSESAINIFIDALGLELPTQGNANHYTQLKQFLWGIANAMRWAMTLSVYAPTPTSFNVVGGDYNHSGVKTLVPGNPIDPADNDTTYVWLDPVNNVIGSDIDGNGWPVGTHVKLAEIDVNAAGVITEIRDLRGQTFMVTA